MDPTRATASSVSQQREHSEPAPRRIHAIETRINELATIAGITQQSITDITTKKSNSIQRAKSLHRIPSHCSSPKEITAFLETSLHNLREELDQLQKEKAHLEHPMADLPLELRQNIITQAEGKTKATIAQASSQTNRLVLESIKMECNAYIRDTITTYKEALASPLIISPKAIVEAVQTSLSTLEADSFAATTNYHEIKEKIVQLRNALIAILSQLQEEDIKLVQGILLSLTPSQSNKKSFINDNFSIATALAICEKKPSPMEQEFAKEHLCRALLRQPGNIGKAYAIISTMRSQTRITNALSFISIALAQEGNFDEAIHIAENLTNVSRKSETLSTIADFFAKTGDIDKELEIVEKIRDETYKSYKKSQISQRLVDHGNFLRALTIAKQITDPDAKQEALDYLSHRMKR